VLRFQSILRIINNQGQCSIFILSSVWIPHEILQLLQVRHACRTRHVVDIVSEGGSIPPDLVLVECFHDPGRVDICADFHHLSLVPSSDPDVDNVKVISCIASMSVLSPILIEMDLPEFMTPLKLTS
jgi:hypothetical protein